MPVVVDASMAGAWILPDEHSRQAEALLKSILDGSQDLAVPDLWSYEMTNVLISAFRRGRIREEQIAEAHAMLEGVPCRYYDHNSELARNRIARFASRFRLSAYDAAYLELADRLQCRLRSADRALTTAATALGLR